MHGPMIVIAGAGSGKTRVLTYKIAYLMTEGVDPFNILALTFTNKAAKEMKERIATIVGDEAKNLWMGTFHSVFARILRIEAHKIGYTSNFTIYDSDDSQKLVSRIIKELNLDKDQYKYKSIFSRISSMKNNFITPNDYLNDDEMLLSDKISNRPKFYQIYNEYVERCFKAGAMDFDDLLLKTNELLNSYPDTLSKYQNIFKYILVDEYQDTNHSQYLIIRALSDKFQNICVVGDDAQSIYSFRGANINNILNFQKDFTDSKIFRLEQNYRSTKNIVNAANSLIENNQKRLEKKVWTENESGEKISVNKLLTDGEEGRFVASSIFENKMQSQLQNSDFAILYRTNAQSRSFEDALRKKNIPYRVYGGLSFYQRKEIKDLLAYYRLSINPNDEEAFKRIINYPTRGIGTTTIQTLNVYANSVNKSIWDIVSNLEEHNLKINSGTKKKLSAFALMINNFIVSAKQDDAYTVSEEIAKQSGIFNHLHKDNSPEGVSRFENIQELLNGIKDFSQTAEPSLNKLPDFMKDVALLTDQDLDNEDDSNKVTLMTVHAAKGLEFPYVFVVGLEENLFPSMMSGQSQEDLEEERRLFYVAITRAEKRLFLSFAKSRFKWGQYIESDASRFINEIDEKYIEKHEAPSINKDFRPHKIFAKIKKEKSNTSVNKIVTARKLTNINRSKNINISASDLSKISNGMIVKHSRFGEGKVISISGEGSNKKATVFFNGIGQKQLLLKFAKLEIIT